MNQKFNFFKLGEREIETVKGGLRLCGCGCAYVNCGGSSTQDNENANFNGGEDGLISPHFEPQC